MILNFDGQAPETKELNIGVKGDNLTDKIEFVLDLEQDGINLADYTPSLYVYKVNTYADSMSDLSIEINEEQIIVTFVIPSEITVLKRCEMQLVFTNGELIWKTHPFRVVFERSIDVSESIKSVYPNILEDLTSRISVLENSSSEETSVREETDASLAQAISDEVNAREGDVATLQGLIETNATEIATIQEKATEAHSEIISLVESKQDTLTFDSVPTDNSENPVTSGGVYDALQTKANTSDIPTKTSDLTNDSGYITKTVQDLANYYLKTETYSQEEVNSKISAIPKFSIEVVDSLPTADISTSTVYLLVSSDEEENLYTEYIYVNESWEKLGTQTVDLSGYATISSVTESISELNTSLQASISDETEARKTADSTLQDNIDALSTSLTDYAKASDLDEAIASIDLSDYVTFSDYAGDSRASGTSFGVVKTDQINGITVSDGVISIMGATDTQVNNKSSNGRPLQAKHIDKIVQLGITTNTNTLTEDEQTSAQEWLGLGGVVDAVEQLQTNIDETPTENSTNTVTSGGVYDSLLNLTILWEGE